MNIRGKIVELSDLFYKDEDNLVLTIFWNSLYIAFFLLPLGINLPTPFFIAAIIFGGINIFKSPKNFAPSNKVLLLFPLYFLLIALSLIYSENISDGLNIFQRSLTLFLFPVIFLFVKEDASSVRKLFDFLLVGLIASFFINFYFTIYDFTMVEKGAFVFNDWEELVSSAIERASLGAQYITKTEFSKLVNPNYVSLYILLVLSFYLKKKLESRIQLLVLTILFLYLFLMASPAAYLTLFIMSLILVFNIGDKNQKYIMCVLLILGTIVFLKNPRIADFYTNVEELENSSEIHRVTVEKSRLLTWNACIQLVREAPILGYGIGDANDVLIERYKELDYFYNYQNRYNAHNQFLQTWLQTGILGFGVLVTIFVLLALRMKRSRNEFSVFLILFISLLFESMLVRFNGIVFFSILVPLLLKKRSILSSRIIRNTPPATIDS